MSTTTPLRFAVVSAGVHDADSWRRRCREIEALGFDALYVPDSSAPQLGPIAALAAAAAHTTTLRIGMLVANNDLRNPVVLARELATLDLLSDGRLDWGMGAGWKPDDVESIGISFDPPAARVDRLIDAVDVMRSVFSGGSTTDQPATGARASAFVAPRPVQQPHPPLLIGAGERRLLTFAGREADIVSVNRSFSTVRFGARPPLRRPDEAVAEQVRWIREAAGSRLADLTISLEVNPPLAVTDDRRGALTRLADAAGTSVDRLAGDPRTWVGSTSAIIDSVLATRERYGVSHWVVYEQYVAEAAPIVAELAGR